MNIERYKMPVIIAAAIHGALFLIMPETTARAGSAEPAEPTGCLLTLRDELAWAEEPEERDDGGAVTDCAMGQAVPEAPDFMRRADQLAVFTVPVTPSRPALEPVAMLRLERGTPSGAPDGTTGFRLGGILDAGQLDRAPRAMVQTSPAYPDDLRRGGIAGSVLVEFIVGVDGKVVKAGAVSWTHREFVDPAVRAVLRWRFEPGTAGGRKVSFRMAVPIEFNAAQ